MSDQQITMSQEEYIKLLQQPLITELKGVNKNIDSKFSTLNDKMDDAEGRNKKTLEDHSKSIKKLDTRMDKNDFRTNLLWAIAGATGLGLLGIVFYLIKLGLSGGIS